MAKIGNCGGRLDFEVHPGATFRFRLVYRPGGTAADLTDCVLYLLAETAAGGEVYYLTSLDGGGIVIDPDQAGAGRGRAVATLPADLSRPAGNPVVNQTLSIRLADGTTRVLGSGAVKFTSMPRAGARS